MNQSHNEFHTGTGVRLRVISSDSPKRSRPVRAMPDVGVSNARETSSEFAVRMVMLSITTAVVVFAVYQL